MPRPYVVTDVFTGRPFAGNPLAVVLDAGGLDGESMQRIANEFNLSETTFVLPPEQGHAAKVRIFTPARELPFAGHPTIGTALVLARRGLIDVADGAVVLEEGAGPVPVRLRQEDGAFVHAEFGAPTLPHLGAAPPVSAVAPALGLAEDDLVTDHGLPVVASSGLPFVVIEVRDRAALGRARLDLVRSERLSPHDAFYLITRDGGEADFQVRMFAPGAGVAEDPATGSAAAALGGWLGERAGLGDGEHRFVLAQGIEMGRPSRLEVTVVREGGTLRAVRVGGGAVEVMTGEIIA